MNKIVHVAIREFVATAMTKAFIIGGFVIPGIIVAVMVVVFPWLLNEKAPEVEGSLVVIDHSGGVAAGIAERLQPEAIATRQREFGARVEEAVGELGREMREGVEQQILAVPRITLRRLDPAADIEAEKQLLRAADADDPAASLALAVVAPDAVVADAGGYGGFELYVRAGLDDRVEGEIRDAIEAAIRHARIVASGLEPDAVEALTTVRAPRTLEVTEAGERETLGAARLFVSFGFMAVLMMSVMFGGQYLLLTTVEEKSSRVVEVLLSALSPMQLMTGKIVGQLGVGLTILVIYGSMGGGALVLFGLADLLGFLPLVYLLVFFLIAYVTVGALMAAVGSAVNDMREAQSLQGPVMILLMAPYMLWFPISRDPNSWFSTLISFVPLINPFVMMLRITSTEPPPTWQVLLSILIGAGGVYAAVWAAAKIFRIGLLMFGKPPNLMTLLRWVRMA